VNLANHATNPILRDPAEQEVSPLELLFDLVFVLGVSQLTRHLVARPSWRGAADVKAGRKLTPYRRSKIDPPLGVRGG